MRIRRRRGEAEIPTSSMADLTFMLIIFFVLTAAFTATKGIDFIVSPPTNIDDPPPTVLPRDSVLVRVSATTTEFDGHPWHPERCPWSEGVERVWWACDEARRLYRHLRAKLGNDPGMPVILYVRPDAPYERMVLAWDVLSAAGHPEAAGVEPRRVFPTQADIQAYEEIWPENPFEIEYSR
jgi:biopolymer transport protein ExbD